MKKKLTANSLVLIGTPVAVSFILLFIYWINDFYPFGEGLVAWCDMDQQVIPMMLYFKNIIRGSDSMLYSFHAAGGMNFWGVFFFFIASPLHLLSLLVPDMRMLEFMNLLTMFKMALCGLSAAWYLTRHQHRPLYTFIFSLLYAFSGYCLMFYQNTIWLDAAALFPCLLLSFEDLASHDRSRYYILAISLQIVICYYIGYMVTVFTLLYFGLLCLTISRENRRTVFVRFIIGSGIAALITAIVWLPSLLQFFSSGRGESIIETLSEKTLFTAIQTTLPILFPSLFAIVAVIYGITHDGLRKGLIKNYLYLLFLTLIPILIEPINTMWHTGNYMSFPVRYGFIPIFLLIVIGAYYLERSTAPELKVDKYFSLIVFFALLLFVFLVSMLTRLVVSAQITSLSNYTHHLWGSTASLQGLFLLLLLELPVILVMIRCLNHGSLSPLLFTILAVFLLFQGIWNDADVYMTSGDSDDHLYQYQQFMDLENFQPPEEQAEGQPDFYRVKMKQKYYHANSLGAMGFNSLGHYTSLTSQSYMFAMKELGYSSYWMEVGGYGGTVLTDAYMSVAYQVEWADGMKSMYANSTYKIVRNPYYLTLGIASRANDAGTNGLSGKTRFEVQKLLWTRLFPDTEPGLVSYEPSIYQDIVFQVDQGLYRIRQDSLDVDGHIIYRIHPDSHTMLYFDCFDELTNDLSEPINRSFRIRIGDQYYTSSYPTSLNNGLLCLGDFEDEDVEVDIELLRPVDCRSFGLFGIDLDLFEQAEASCETLGFKKTSNRSLSAFSSFEEARTVYLSVPFDSGLTLKIDGKKAPLSESFDGFCSFVLPAGSHEISISYLPPGFIAGTLISLVSLILFLIFLFIRPLHEVYKKIIQSVVIQKISLILTLAASLVVYVMIYVFPMIVYLLEQIRHSGLAE